MIGKKLSSRIKATVLSAVMTATVFISPAAFQITNVSAAGSVSINKTLTATTDDSSSSTRATRFNMSGLGTSPSKVTLNFETAYTGDVTVGIGYNLKADPYWEQADGIQATPRNGKFSVTYTFPSSSLSSINFASGQMEVAIWYPQSGETFKLVSATTEGGTDPGPVNPDKPVTQNKKSGEWTFTDNKDGTATISSTLTAEIDDQEMDYLLTKGYDEEGYLDEDGNSTWQEGDPINSHKFQFSEFGIDDLNNLKFESFNYTIQSDKDMSKFMYGGGINVEPMSPADTEYVKGKNGYWYNDQGEEDMAEYGDQFQIEVNNGYTVTDAGSYIEVVWDVPKDVQEYVSKNVSDSVGFQFWYAQDANPPEGEDYAEIDEVHLKTASCTYTREITVPYNKTVSKTVNQKLTPGSDETTNQYKFMLSDLGLENRDLVSAVKFNVTSSVDLEKYVGGVGISVANANPNADEGWYMPANITVLEPGKEFEIMWIVPESIRKDVDILSGDGNVMFGCWYAGEESPTITLKSIDFYEFVSNEEDLVVEPEKIEIKVGETQALDINVPGCTFISSNQSVAIAENDVVSGIGVGQANIVVTSPEGQEKMITVKVTEADPPETTETTAPVTTTITTTTTSVVTTTVDPDDIIDWDKVLYGDVNIDGNINIADVVTLNMYLLYPEVNKLNATAKENAQVVYDGIIDTQYSLLLMNYVAMIVTVDQLGPQN